MSAAPAAERAVILAGGTVAYTPELRTEVASCGLVIAADGGLRHAQALGATPSCLIGDLDSVSEADTAPYPRLQVITYPVDKDELDSELAVAYALALGARGLLLVGGTGDRWDHSLTNLCLAARLAAEGTRCELSDGLTRIVMVAPRLPWSGELNAGDSVGLVPLQGDAEGVSTSGVAFPLRAAALRFGTGQGASNRATGGLASVACARGLLALTLRGVEPGRR